MSPPARDEGKRRSSTEKSKMAIMANQNIGIDIPLTAKILEIVSRIESFFTAAVTPRINAKKRAMKIRCVVIETRVLRQQTL